MSEQQMTTERLAELAERLTALGWEREERYEPVQGTPLWMYRYVEPSFAWLSLCLLKGGALEFEGSLEFSETWEALDAIRSWQSGPASDRDRTELTPRLRIAMRFATVLIRDVLSDHSEESTERLSEISHYVEDTGEWDDELGWSDLADVLEAAIAAGTESPR